MDGIQEAAQGGVIAGYPVIDFKVTYRRLISRCGFL